jgi:hypothetical protein
MTAPLRLQAWRIITEDVTRRIGMRDRELLALLERAEADLHHGWPEAARDCTAWAPRLFQIHTGGMHQ